MGTHTFKLHTIPGNYGGNDVPHGPRVEIVMKYVFRNEDGTICISQECVTPDEFLHEKRRLIKELDEMERQMKRVFTLDNKRFQKYLRDKGNR